MILVLSMNRVISICLIIVGIINFIPAVGVVSAQQLESAYDISLASNDLIILMRHRALLFGVLGGFVCVAAFYRTLQVPAMLMAATSMLGFVALVFVEGDYNAAILRVLIVDLVGIGFLLISAVMKYIIVFREHNADGDTISS